MFNHIVEEVQAHYSYMEAVRLRKALIILGYSDNSAYERLYLDLVSMSRLHREELLQRIRLAYKEVK